ncbi:hypothetical protein HAX54_003899 [Datura stramonium]|uniref:Uncharacterized protein n=1 Tax=Datura stramonium TaxID=4076 RepID=A0ABS8T648_DATST|nr:hypothetical protein [Datura stramonium]
MKKELVFLEEERARNEQFQASIAKISQRQSEALIKRRKGEKDSQGTEPERSDPNESENDEQDENKDSPLKDERGTQTKFKETQERKGAPTSQTSPSAASPDGGHIETACDTKPEMPYLCCTPSTSVGHLCELVAQETKSQAKDVGVAIKVVNTAVGKSTINHSILMDASIMLRRNQSISLCNP